ncbi:hypothetical protein [Paenibacillus agilis]|uniref:Leucine-rich repeat domain-containing protein n=1 Tax=Paenibacillus agilis TaxID=3020863 RepID=A0A559IQ61_9BACL|nr:hypothetical protein [Paenibacillus agilis]TVX89768.1 hypothetical protein FPZ44_18630 [Paenibacillus agilis]
MRKIWKRKILINDPTALDRDQIEQDLRHGNQVIVQFSHPNFYGSILEEVDELCARLDENFGVRFYGHYSLSFDGHTLLRIPHVKSLHLNSLTQAHNTEVLATLKHLYALHIGIYELENSDILSIDTLWSLRELSINSEKKMLNLQYFKEFNHLEQLHVGGKVKNLDTIGDLQDLSYLALHSISKHPLHFVNRLRKLKHFRLLLGGRENIQEIEENEIDDLEISRVRGFHDLSNIANFQALTRLKVEDQVKLHEVSFSGQMKMLEELSFWNCKNVARLTGLEQLSSLRKLRLLKTSVDFESFIQQQLPSSLSTMEFVTGKNKADQEIKQLLLNMGYNN